MAISRLAKLAVGAESEIKPAGVEVSAPEEPQAPPGRLPTRAEVIPVLGLCVTLVHSWSIYHFLANLPGWLFYLSAWDIAGIFAYSQLFAMVESLLILLVVGSLAVVLPRRLFRDHFIAGASLFVLVTAAWAIVIHIYGFEGLPLWPSRRFIAALALYLFTIVSTQAVVHRWPAVERAVAGLVQRLPVFLYVYLPLAAVSLVVVLIRNF